MFVLATQAYTKQSGKHVAVKCGFLSSQGTTHSVCTDSKAAASGTKDRGRFVDPTATKGQSGKQRVFEVGGGSELQCRGNDGISQPLQRGFLLLQPCDKRSLFTLHGSKMGVAASASAHDDVLLGPFCRGPSKGVQPTQLIYWTYTCM